MYRRGLFSLYHRTPALNHAHDPGLRPRTCTDRVSGLSAAYLVNLRAFGTSGARLFEQKNDGERSEEPRVVSRTRDEPLVKAACEEAAEGNKMRREAMSQNADEITESDLRSAEEQMVEGKAEENMVEKAGQKAGQKTGKQGLLELLGAMKVDTMTKAKMKSLLKVTAGEDGAMKQKRVVMESTSTMFQQATSPQSESLSPELVAAASAAASTLPDGSHAESELLQQLRKLEAVCEKTRRGETQDIGNIIADMRVGKKPGGRMNSRPANQIRFDDDGRGYTHDRGIMGELAEIRRRNSAFTGKRLNIFSAADLDTHSDLAPGPSLWDAELANKITQLVNQRPRNGFEEMIQWTREGMLWQYPINNEAGMEEEAKVPFYEHVFLHHHLEDGFPQHGPIRHFMELVLTGLAKNPHLTVKQKLQHITWYRDYFLQKQDILSEV